MQGAKLVNLSMSSRGSELTQLLTAVKYLGPVVPGFYLVDSQHQDHQRSMDQETARPQRGCGPQPTITASAPPLAHDSSGAVAQFYFGTDISCTDA